MRWVGSLAVLLIGCSSPREDAADRHVVDSIVAQLAPVMRVEPAGTLAVVSTQNGTTIVRGDAKLTIAAIDVDERTVVKVDEHTSLLKRPGVDVVRITSAGRFEELRRVHVAADRVELRYEVTLGGALTALRATAPFVEALDQSGVARLRTEPAFAVDKNGVTRALEVAVEGTTIRWTLDARGLAAPIAIDPAWTTTASLAVPRIQPEAFPIAGKKVVVFGGQLSSDTTEIYDDATASWTFGPKLSRVRLLARAARLTDGRIFVAAGNGDPEDPPTADVFDPVAKTITRTSPMPISMAFGTSAALPGGNALVTARSGAVVWTASTNTWTTVSPMITPRVRHHAFSLSSGKVLLLGGRTDPTVWQSSVELYDPVAKTFSARAPMPRLRVNYAPAQNGDKIFITGGNDSTDADVLYASTDVYDATTNTWTAGPPMTTARDIHAAALMADGRVLVAGGEGATSLLRSAEILDFTAKTTVSAGLLNAVRGSFPLVPIVAGENRFLAVSGYNGGATPEVELFVPAALGATCTGSGECVSGFCVDGVCCEKAACGAGETCSGATPGRCRGINGKSCTAGDQCASGQCIDGVCCNSACGGICQACDLAASLGSCATLPPGDSPHGARTKCPGVAPCQGVCGGVESDKCTVFPGAAVACGEVSCKDGEESAASFCDGAGGCATAPRVKCEPFACGDTSCKRACAVDSDCATGYTCDARTGRCVFGAKCDGDHTVTVPSAASIDCTPYKCAGSSCLEKCTGTGDCVAGTTCDTSTGKCVPSAAPAAEDDGGCTTTRAPRPPTWFALFTVLAALGLIRRSR